MKIAAILPIALATAQPAWAEPARTATPQASIPFANHDGVRNWRAEGNDVIYFEDARHNWYKAVLFAPVPELPFTEAIAIDTSPGTTLDKFGAVIVKGQRYPFVSFEKVEGPPKKQKTKKG